MLSADLPAAVAPGATIGILGGGQLGKMLAVAAAALGYRCHIFDPHDELPAATVAAAATRADFSDEAALRAFASQCAVVTYEFENVPADAVAFLSKLVAVHPNARALHVAQDRLPEKNFAHECGGGTAPYRAVGSRAELDAALDAIGTPAVLKTRRFGYDGKGQVRIHTPADADAAWAAIGPAPDGLILEGFVPFEKEFSIILARRADGSTRAFPAVHNEHRNGVLYQSHVPAAGLSPAHVEVATALTARMAEKLDYVGVLTAEFFATADGPLLNEIAPRVHNSGHWSIEGAETSQFEQHIRAICNLPFGSVALTGREVMMQNLLGEEANAWPELLAEPGTHLHLYGKSEIRAGRKMGHFTRVTR